MLTLKKVKELVEAPVHTKRVPSPKMLLEEGLILLRKEFEHGSHLTVYNSGYVLFSAGKRNTVFHIHDCQGDYAYDAAEGKGDVIQEEYFENCEWHIRALFEGERKMEESQVKCEVAGQTNVSVSYHAVSEEWGEIADRTINILEKIIENEAVHAMLCCPCCNIKECVIIWATKQPERGHYESDSMAVKIGSGDYNPATDPCCVADKVVCGISASLFGMDFLSAGQCDIGNGDSFVPHAAVAGDGSTSNADRWIRDFYDTAGGR